MKSFCMTIIPILHKQAQKPAPLTQLAFLSQGLSEHSLTSWHSKPLPEKPGLHEQVQEPALLLQSAFTSHGCFEHSSTSAQKRPEQKIYC